MPFRAKREKTKRLTSIQSMRGYAAVLVLIAHSVDLASMHGERFFMNQWLHLENFGAIGVDLFFVISGFVMANSVANRNGPRASQNFLVMRWLRIAPPYIIISFILIAITIAQRASINPISIANLFLFIPWFDTSTFTMPPLDVGWTLSFEFTFYLLVALMVLLRLGDKIEWLSLGIVALVGLGFVLPDDIFLLQWVTNPIFLEFALGIGAYSLWKRRALATARVGWLALGLSGGLVLIVQAVMGFGDVSEVANIVDGTLSLQRVFWWGVPGAAIFIAVIAFERASTGIAARIGGRIGDASYSIYLVHVLALMVYSSAVTHMPFGLPPTVVFVGAIAVGICAGMFYFRFVENPLRLRMETTATIMFRMNSMGNQPQ